MPSFQIFIGKSYVLYTIKMLSFFLFFFFLRDASYDIKSMDKFYYFVHDIFMWQDYDWCNVTLIWYHHHHH